MRKRATFEIKPEGAGPLDVGSIAVGCWIEWDAQRQLWRIYQDEPDVGPIWDEDSVQGALLHLAIRFSAERAP